MISFSIITSTLNSSKYVEKCLTSVSHQTYKNYEHLIVDGGSSDNTVEIVKKFTNNNLKLVCSEPDNGIYHAWNKALNCSEGDWLITLGSDDYFLSKFDLEFVANFIDKCQNLEDINFLYAETSDENELKLIKKNSYLSFFRGTTPYPTAVFINRKIIKQGSKFDESFKICGDHKFFAENNFWEKSIHIPRKIYHFTSGGISTNKKFKLLNYKERKKMLIELGRKRPLIFDIYYYLRARF